MLQQGLAIDGKWTKTTFYVERALGSGANGEVYLVRTPRGKAAMKVCSRATDIALEWGLLEKLSAKSNVFPRPMVIDDMPPDVYFYVMEWIEGLPFHKAAAQMTPNEFVQAVSLVLRGLGELHNLGYAFCDIKPENILVTTTPTVRVRFVDVGGVTQFGRSVRQFTPFYDRGFWGLGSRKAESTYDLFGLGCVLLFSYHNPPDILLGKTPAERTKWLKRSVATFPYRDYIPILEQVFEGRFPTSVEFDAANQTMVRSLHRDLKAQSAHRSAKQVHRKAGKPMQPIVSNHTTSRITRRAVRMQKRMDWTERLMWASLSTAAMVTLTAWMTFLGWF